MANMRDRFAAARAAAQADDKAGVKRNVNVAAVPSGTAATSKKETSIQERFASARAQAQRDDREAKQKVQAAQPLVQAEEEDDGESYSLLKGGGGVVRKGLNQIAQAGGNTLAMAEDIVFAPFELASGQKLGELSDTGPLNTWARKIREEGQAAEEHHAENVKAGGVAAEWFDRLGSATIAAVPQAVVAMLTGGASAAATTTAGLQATAASAISPGLAHTIQTSVSKLASDPQYWLAFSQTVGNSYESAIADMEARGDSDSNTIRAKAALQAIGNGLMGAAAETGGGIQKLPDELRQGESVWKAIVDTALDEGKEEVVQGIIDRATQNLVYDRGYALASLTDPEAVFSLPAAGEEFIGGAVVGGLLGGGQTAAINLLTRAAEQVAQGGTVTNRTAERILADQEAVDALAEAAGVTIDPSMTMSQQRAAVKTAVEALASRETGRAETSAGISPTQQSVAQETAQERPAAQQAYDTMRMKQAASALGENGAKALTAAYDGKARSDSFYGGFAAYYEAGVSGQDMGKVRSEYASQLNEAQKFAAYSAGQNDAAASLARQQRAAQFARVAGTDSGLVFDDYVADTMDSAAADRVNSVAKLLGLRVRFVDSVRGGTANAQISGSEVLVERNNQEPVMFLLGHEWTHRMQELAPVEYRAFREAVAEEVQGDARNLLEHYRRSGEDISYEEALDEAAANYAGSMIQDGKVLDDFIAKHKGDRSMLEKVRDAIRELVRKLTGAEKRMAQTAEDKLAAALEAAAKQAGTLQAGVDGDTMGATRNSLKEDLENGRARKEERAAFLQRAAGAGYAVYEGKTAAYGYRNVRGRSAQRNARQVQEEVKKLGIDAEIIDGPLLWNRDGITGTREVQQAVTVDRARIFINNAATISPRNIAGHEAFHLWRSGTGRDAYIETVDDNLLFSSEAFREYQSSIAEAYLGGEADLNNDAQMEKLREELFAYISGDIHEGVYDDFLRTMLRDFDAVKAAWNELVAANASTTRFSMKKGLDAYLADLDAVTAEIAEVSKQDIFAVFDESGNDGMIAFMKKKDALAAKKRRIERKIAELTAPEIESADPVDSKAFKLWFGDWSSGKGSKVVDADGRPLVVYHGTGTTIEEFLPEFTGQGNDQYGSGFYFTTDKSTADGYTTRTLNEQDKPGGTDNPNVIPVYLNIRHPLVVDATKTSNLYSIDVSPVMASRIISRMPDIMDPENSVLGDYFDEYWERGPKNYMISQLAREYEWTLGSLATDIFRDYPTEYRQAVRDVLGYDGVQINFKNGEKHFVAWFPNQIKHATENSGAFSKKDNRIKYSIKSDSSGHSLTAGQQEYFRDSKVVDEQGRLKIMYRGGNSEFTVFDRKKSSYSNLYGRGFYFTDSEAHARQYGNAREFYLNITNPVPTGETTITRSQMRKFLEAVAENEDDFSFENYGYGATVDSVLKSVYGKSDFAMLYDVSQTAIGDMVAAVELFNDVNGTGFDGLILDTETVAFYSDQIKNTTNQTPTKDPDIRHSLKGSESYRDYSALQKENDLLRERVEYWKGQTQRTRRVTTDKKAVTRAARELIRRYGSEMEVSEIADKLQSLYDYIASGYEGDNELTYTEARRRAEEIGRELVARAVAVDDDVYMQYSDLRSYLRKVTLTISEEDSRNIADYGDFRKRNMGRMNLTKGNTNIDQVYMEMSELWPEFFDSERESHPADQLAHIAEVMEDIYQITEYNPFSGYIQRATADAANEVMELFFDLPQTRATFADRQARKLDDAKARGRQQVQRVREQNAARLEELRRQNRERVQETIQRERQRREAQLESLRSRYRERDAAGRERRNARELRARIIRHANALSKKLLRPSDKQHIPENLRQATAAVLEAINLESAYSVDQATGRRVRDGSGTPTKRTEAFRQLRLAYADITREGGDYTLIIDPDLMDNLNEIEAMKDTPLGDLGTGQLSTIWATIQAVEHSITTANKMLGTSRFETISAVADGIKADNLTRKDRGDFRGAAGWVDKKTNFDMLTPQGYFHRLGKTGEELFRMMRSAQDRHIESMHQAKEVTRKIIGTANVNKLEEETHTFDLDGGKLTMSTAQIMALYELMKRQQAHDHILKGGIRPEAIGGKGLRESRRSAPVRVTPEDLATITGVLTEEQRRMADGLQKYMGGKLAELGNEASMEVYGYRKFTEKNYFPIQVDKNQTRKDIAKEAQAATIAGRGFTKGVTPHANNAVMLNSIFDVYASHVNDMATYAAWLSTMENVRRIRDFTFRDAEGNRTGDVKSVIERVFGKNGNAYLNKLVDDINQGIRPSGAGGLNTLLGNYKAAAVAGNLRVILQQPTSILRALDSLDPKYLLAGTVKRGDWEKVMKYAPIARWKDWGYFDINTGRQMKDVLLNSDSKLEKIKQAFMAPAGKADSFAWARLWNAVEAETKDKRPGLKPGTEPFYQAVSARFSEIVDRTQVVDGLLQRSQIMRSPDALDKMATSFMGEPTKTYNMFVNAVYDLRHAEGKDARTKAKRGLARATTALVTSFAVNAVMQSVVDALRDDDKERDYWEKTLAAYTGFTGDEESFLDYWNSFWDGNLQSNFNPLSYVPYAKDILSIAQGYDVTRMDMEPISKVWDAAVNMKKALSGDGKYTIGGASANLLAEAARLLGVPVANLKRDIHGAIVTAAIETDNYLMQYRIDKAMLNMGYSSNSGNFLDILYNASVNDPEAYEIIYADMVTADQLKTATQTTQERIASGMESRMKKAQGVESVKELKTRYLTPAQTKSYDRLYSRVTASPVWNQASAKQRSDLEDDLYDLTVGNSNGAKIQEKISGGAVYGLDETDYLLYRLALHMADQPTESGKLGSYTSEEVQAAIDMLTGLNDRERAYLWEAQGKSEKSNPYK